MVHRDPPPHYSGGSHDTAHMIQSSFFDIVLGQMLMPTWLHFAPQLGPKIAVKSIQELSKIDPKSHLIVDPFFDRCLIDFCSIFDPQIEQKSVKNQSTNHPNNTSTKNCKTLKKQVFNVFGYFGHVCCGKKTLKMMPRSFQKQLPNQHPNLHRFGSQLGSIGGGFWGSRCR